MSIHRRTLMALLAAASSYLLFATTERCFESADRRNAVMLVQTLRVRPGAPTIPEALVDRHRGTRVEDIQWSATLTDKHYGFVRVRAEVPDAGGPGGEAAGGTRGGADQGGGPGGGPTVYVFDVNLAANRLHPGNDDARALFGELAGRGAIPAPGGDGSRAE